MTDDGASGGISEAAHRGEPMKGLRRFGDGIGWRLAIAGLLLSLAIPASADPGGLAAGHWDEALVGLAAPEQGRALFAEKDRLESGYRDLRVDLEMVLRDQRGSESHRLLSISQLEMADAGDRLLVVFDSPKQIRGTALLCYSYTAEPDDQWLYLPAVKRVKRIASQNKSGPFLSSEFAFEDMMLQELDKFDYEFVGRERCGDLDCYRVIRRPVDEHSGYSRQEVLLETQSLRIERIDYFDRVGRPLKTLEVTDYLLFEDRYWKAGRMRMDNLQTGKSTELLWHDYRFGNGLVAERDFSTNSLARAR